MKSQFQTLSFLANYTPKSPIDGNLIKGYLTDSFHITPKTPIFSVLSDSNPLDAQSFILWVKSGLNALKIVRHNNQTVILGKCLFNECEIIGTLLEDGTISTEAKTILPEEVSEATEEEIKQFQIALHKNLLQPSVYDFKLVPKYIPKNEDRVIFYDYSLEVQGIGIVRSVAQDGEVTFYCYVTRKTSSHPQRLGYSMHETPGFNLRTIVFENIQKENTSTILGNTTSCYRTLRTELEKAGKVWRDKLCRIEPLDVELEQGDKYYFITDKLDVKCEFEKGTPTSHLRYLSGNYFTDVDAAKLIRDRLKNAMKDYLASDDWPKLK